MALERWPVSLDIAVAWGDMDAFAHVNNTVYLRWFESARILYFEKAGLLARMKAEGLGPILARSTVDYRRPLAYPDRVRAEATVSRLGTTSFTMKYRVTSAAHPEGPAAEGESVVVMVDYRNGTKVPLDADLLRALHALEDGAA